MTSVRLVAVLSTLLLVVGALLVGEALHGGVVTGARPLGSPWVVLRVVVGAVFIALGYRFRPATEEYVAMPSGGPDRSDRSNRDAEGAPDAGATGEFDPEMSPLGEGGLEHVGSDGDADSSAAGEKDADERDAKDADATDEG